MTLNQNKKEELHNLVMNTFHELHNNAKKQKKYTSVAFHKKDTQ
jgi:hypothetical protein